MSTELDIEVISQRHVSNPEARVIVERYYKDIEEKEGTISHLVAKTLEYLEKFSKITMEDAEKLYRELEEYGLKEETRINIINICPETSDELRTILVIEGKEKAYDPEVLEKILETINKYCKK